MSVLFGIAIGFVLYWYRWVERFYDEKKDNKAKRTVK